MAKGLEFISPSNEYSGLISFRIDRLDLLAVQGTLKSLQHHSSKASILQHSAFFTDQLSHSYVTTGKTIVLTRRTFVGKVMSMLVAAVALKPTTFRSQPAANAAILPNRRESITGVVKLKGEIPLALVECGT